MFRVGGTRRICLVKQTSKPLASSKTALQSFSRNAQSFHQGSTARSFSSTSKKSSLGLKIGVSLALLTGGGLAGGALLYNYNNDFRKFVNQSLPIIETFNLALGPATSSKNDEINSDDEKSLLRPKKVDLKPIVDLKQPAEEKQIETKKNVASLSSLDQVAVSSVDLDIATKVEDEVTQAKKEPHPPPSKATPKPPGGGGTKESVASFVSAVDQPAVSAVDQDIARVKEAKVVKSSTEQADVASQTESAQSQPMKTLSKEDIVQSIPVDTSLTDKELENIVSQTAMEVLIEEALVSLKQACQEAVEAQKKATVLLQDHVTQLKNALENEEQGSMKDLSKIIMKSQKEAEDAIKAAKTSQIMVNQEVEKVHSVVKEAEASGAHKAGIRASKEAARVSYDVINAVTELEKAKSEDMILEEHKKFLWESRKVLTKELEEIFPNNVDDITGKKRPKSGDSKSEAVLLAYARKRLDHLKQQLANQREEEQKRLEQILNIQKQEDEKLTEMKVKQELDKLKAEFEITLKKRESALASEHETVLRQQLRRQAAAYSDHLTEVLSVQANELQQRYDKEMNEKLTEGKEIYADKLTTALARLRGIESAVDTRANNEKSNQKFQELWLACQALQTTIEGGMKVLKPLYDEVGAITAAADGDPIMNDVISAIPQEALNRGVYSDKNLAARFTDVKKSCRRVAMIGDDNKGPWTYFLSYIQSFFVFDKFDPRVDGESVDLESIDTFGILARAEYYVHKGDLELAARCVNQLKGEPRKLAYDWLREVRLLLETKQATRFLSSYATATGMDG